MCHPLAIKMPNFC